METARSNTAVHLYHLGNHKFLEFLRSLPCVSYELDADLSFKTLSPNVIELLGIRPESLQGNRVLWRERLFQEDRSQLMTKLDQIAPGEFVSEVHRIINDAGLPVWVSHSFWRVGDRSHGCIRGSMIPLPTDTCTKFLDNEVISQFVHKIGNHYQLINLLIGSLKRSGMAGSEVDALQETVDRAVEFTRSFAYFTQVPVRTSAVDLGEILRSVIQSMAPLFAERNVVFNVPVDASLDGIFVAGDPLLLELAFTSILENALNATKSGDHVSVDPKKERREDTRTSIAWISIIDTGCGMGKVVLANASSPFFSTKPERNGLGLTTAIRIIEMHGGLLSISSEEAHGTHVDIILPVVRAPSNSEAKNG
jgi:Histidine kinase-, DNA gyrase B-, and HSP90-like ATPase/PAS fold